MWFKKKSVLQADGNYDTEKSADRTTDLRTTVNFYSNTNSSINNGVLPSAVDAGNYFYLPALGYYRDGRLYLVGGECDYWSSSAQPWSSYYAYVLGFNIGGVFVTSSAYCYRGYRVEPTFE